MKNLYSRLCGSLGATWASFRTYLALQLVAAVEAAQRGLRRALDHSYAGFCVTLSLIAVSALLAKLADAVAEWSDEVTNILRSFPNRAKWESTLKGTFSRR